MNQIARTQARTSPVFLRRPSFFFPRHSLSPKCERNLHLRPTRDHLSGAIQKVVTHSLAPPPLHSSTVCHGCFKTIWPGCANGWLFWERDGKTVCYSRRPSEKKRKKEKKTRDCKEGVFAKESRGSSCVWVCGKHVCLCVCVCVRNQPYQRQSVVLGSCVAGDPRDRCWNQRFHSLAKLRRTLKFILWQLLVVSSAFPPHHDRHLGFITAKISHLCGCFCCSNSCADLHKLAHVVRAWFMRPLCPACGTFFFFFFFLNKRIHLAWSSWLTKLPVLGAFRPFGNEPDQQVEQWNMPVSERGISVCLHLKHHLPLWNLTNASKKKKKTHTKKTFAGRRHESSSCLTLFKVAYKSWDAQYITLKLLSALGLL